MIQHFDPPPPDALPKRVNEFLELLPGPTMLTLPGKDTSRTRVLVTLSHGNEPSGLEALLSWLRSGATPATNVVVLLGAVDAARAEPLFFHRQLPGERDLNRCFRPPYEDRPGRIAAAISQHIRDCEPEAIVDLHNTSGTSEGFAVTVADTTAHRALIKLFVDQAIITELSLGSIMEQPFACPIVTIEAGGSQDESSGRVAGAGLVNYFSATELFSGDTTLQLFHQPMRLELSPQSRIDYAARSLHDRDVTIRNDIERFNFRELGTDEPLGWLGDDGLAHLVIGSDASHPHALTDYFRQQGNALYARQPLHIFMATTRPDIAASDCLFYFVATD